MRQVTLKTLSNCTKSTLSHIDRDFFGIAHVTSKDVAGCSKSGSKLALDQLSRKYQPLMISRQTKENHEHDVDVTFGRLRIDNDNIVRIHGQFEPTNERQLYETTDIKQKYVPIDEDTSGCSVNNKDAHLIETIPDPEVVGVPSYNRPYKFCEVGNALDLSDVLKLFKTPDTVEDTTKYSNKPPLTFFFKRTRQSCTGETNEGTKEKDFELANGTKLDLRLSGRPLDAEELESTIVESSNIVDTKPILEYDPKKDKIPLMDLDKDSEEYHERNMDVMQDFDRFDKSIEEKFDIGAMTKYPRKGLDYLKDIRAKKIEPTAKGLKHRLEDDNAFPLDPQVRLDSQGFKIYTHQVPNWAACRHVDLLNHVRSSIVYNNYDILAVNKPYGIASHPDNENKGLNMNSLVQELATKMRLEKVYLTHRLDRDTTGVLMFATSQKRANYLSKLFAADEIKKTYLCITIRIPEINHAIIDIPIGKYQVAGKVRSCVAPVHLPEERQLDKKSKEAKRAITEYRILKVNKNVALIEVKPRTGVKHQIRCHMSFGLNTPILGDHKYSHLDKLAPQRLSSSTLKAFHMRPAKTRTLPMHLHARSIVIPGAKANGETLFIKAPLPDYFVQNLKTLNLWDQGVQ